MAMKAEDAAPSVDDARRTFSAALGEGLSAARDRLRRLRGDPPHVVILESGTDDERTALALWYAALLDCPNAGDRGPCLSCPTCLQIGARVHADLSVLDPRATSMLGGRPAETSGKTGGVGVDSIRELRAILSDAVHGDGCRVTLLLEAQALNPSCGNALLKVMEEPYPHVHFVMTVPHRGRLLPTLVSRGWTLTLPWPDPWAADPGTLDAMRALADFLRTGRAWFASTGGRGANAMNADKARRLLVAVRKELSAGIAGRPVTGSPSEVFARLSPAGQAYAADVLSQAQTSVDCNVNPGLVMDWMGARLFASTRRLAGRT